MSPLPPLIILAFSLSLLRTFMAGNTVGKITNSFFLVLRPDIGFGVFVAAITGVAAVVVGQMAGAAPTVVVAVQHKVG